MSKQAYQGANDDAEVETLLLMKEGRDDSGTCWAWTTETTELKQAVYWKVNSMKQELGRPRKNWNDTVLSTRSKPN